MPWAFMVHVRILWYRQWYSSFSERALSIETLKVVPVQCMQAVKYFRFLSSRNTPLNG